MSAARRPAHSLVRIFAIPLVIGALSAVGLVTALIGDHGWDAASWLTLGIPVAVIGWCIFRKRPARKPV